MREGESFLYKAQTVEKFHGRMREFAPGKAAVLMRCKGGEVADSTVQRFNDN